MIKFDSFDHVKGIGKQPFCRKHSKNMFSINSTIQSALKAPSKHCGIVNLKFNSMYVEPDWQQIRSRF